MKTIFISGDGVAACCCANLLKQAGFRVAVKRRERPRLPAILLSDAALALIQGVFGELSFDQPHPIRRRVVAWGPDSQALTVEHSARVVVPDPERAGHCLGACSRRFRGSRKPTGFPLPVERTVATAYCRLNICSVWTLTPLGVVTSDSDVSVFPSGDTIMWVVTAGRPAPSIRTL